MTRYIVRPIPAIEFVRGLEYVVYDRWMGCDVGTPLPWREVVASQALKLNNKG